MVYKNYNWHARISLIYDFSRFVVNFSFANIGEFISKYVAQLVRGNAFFSSVQLSK
jgi:hypothetical protein